MPWNLLLLPLVAGYYIFTKSYFFKFKQQRIDQQRLVFESIILAVAASIITYSIRLFYESVASPEFQNIVYKAIPIKSPYAGTSLCILLLSITFTEISNLFLDEKKRIIKAIKAIGNEFELQLKSSFTENKLLLFTLNNGKIYIAWVKELPIPSVSKYVRIIPIISGYRDDQKNVVFTTHYLSVYGEYIKEGKVQSISELNTDVILNSDDIVTVSFFDNEMYKVFNKVGKVES
ncbi:hypothetical protein [uncultured Fluviicola sp.]|uniref:hypothetical protein n=1 Tax=uncultured Fluviicola sp. TaxID=463303 RepID=UPI0025EDA014|nr:hypothetical protein [uncultured Fluviicola sp.]